MLGSVSPKVDFDSESEDEFQEQVSAEIHRRHSDSMLPRLLFESVVRNRAERVRQLLDLGADFTRTIDPRLSHQPLHLATMTGCAGREAIRALCDAGASVNQPDALGFSPAKLAVLFGRLDALEEMRLYGADLSFLPGPFREFILGENCDYPDTLNVSFHGNIDLLQKVLWRRREMSDSPEEEKLSRNEKGKEELGGIGQSEKLSENELLDKEKEDLELKKKALKFASWRGHHEVVALLLSVGVPAEFEDKDSITPLTYAVQCRHTRVVQCLLQGGANATKVGPSGMSLLETAVVMGSMDILRLLLDHGVSPDLTGDRHSTALMKAAVRYCDEAIQILLLAGANVNKSRPDGCTALMAACAQGGYKVARELIAAGANVNASVYLDARQNISPLMVASFRGKYRCIRELLLSNQLDINKKDSSSQTGLHYCCMRNYRACALLLLQAGIDKWTKNERGKTAMQLAKVSKYSDLCELVKAFHPSLEELCLQKIRGHLPSLITAANACQLPLPSSMVKKLLFVRSGK